MDYVKYYNILAEETYDSSLTENDFSFFAAHNLFVYIYSRPNAGMKIDPIHYNKFLLIQKLKFKKIILDLLEVTEAFSYEGIDYRVIKGISIAMSYPEPFTRLMGDHDILVKPEDYERAFNTLKSLGYNSPNRNLAAEDVPFYRENTLSIELHKALLNKQREVYADELMEMLWQEPVDLVVDNKLIKIPNKGTHYKYIVLHMMKHLKYKGFGLRHLLDIVYYSQTENIDLKEHLPYFESIGYGMFYKYIVALCVYYLKLPMDDISWLPDKEEPYLVYLSEYIAESGTFGFATEQSRIDYIYEKYTGRNEWSKTTSIRKAFFPTRDLLSHVYTYAQNRPLLLPVAWIHRFLRLVIRKDYCYKEKLFLLTKDYNAIIKKELMMKHLGLCNESKDTETSLI